MASTRSLPKEALADQRQQIRRQPSFVGPITRITSTRWITSTKTSRNGSFLAAVLILLCLSHPPIIANAWVVPNSNINTNTKTLQRHDYSPTTARTRTITRTHRRVRTGIPPLSTSQSTSTPQSHTALWSTLEDHKSEEDQSGPAPRRTRRIDDILEEYEETGDAGRTISVLESSLKKEQEKSGTLAVRLAYAEQVIAEQKKRLEVKRSSLQSKTQALSETQKKLKELEQKLNGNSNSNGIGNSSMSTSMSPSVSMPPPQTQQSPTPNTNTPLPWQETPLTAAQRQYPLITNWSINRNSGEVTGSVSCHPSIPDGTTIVTSGLNAESFAIAGDNFVFDGELPATVVTTRTGSMYMLGVKKVRRQQAQPPRGPPQQNPMIPASFQLQQQQQQQKPHPSNDLNPNLEFPLTGQSISDGRGTKYLLAGAPKRKPSGRSEIVMAYKCDDQLRVCDSVTPYIVKLSTHKDKLKREYDNFRLVQEQTVDKNKNNGWMGGISHMFDQQQPEEDPFVTCYDFLSVCEGSIKYAQHSAIVLEKGHEDMRDYEYRLQVQDDPEYPTPTVMDPSVVQSTLLVAAKCLQVLHSRARLVWTDLKAENLIFMELQNDALEPIVKIKGVDLESAIPHRGNPLDYTPEACPPEFAQFHLKGNAYDFVLDYSYDVWSFGMLAYELSTGKAYFKGKTPTEIMTILSDPQFVPPLGTGPGSATESYDGSVNSDHPVADKDLRELIRACLQLDPRRRISVQTILKHPYFQQQQQQLDQGASGQSPYDYESSMGGGSGGGGGGTFW